MHLSEHSLRQLDHAYLDALDEAALRGLSAKLLDDLQEAWDRLNQGPENSSRPPSRRAPWERKGGAPELDAEADAITVEGDRAPEPAEAKPAEAKPAEAKPARKPGKPPGRRGSAGPRYSRPMPNRPTTPTPARAVVGRWSRRGRWPTPAFRRSICTGRIQRSRG